MTNTYPPYIDGMDTSIWPPEQFPWMYPSLYPDYYDSIVQPEATPAPEATPEPDPVPPMEVIPVDELLDRLTQGNEADNTSEESQGADEQSFADPGDTIAIELDPGDLAVVDAVNRVRTELVLISDQLAELQLSGDRPLLTTSFSDYTVTEGLLLLLLLCVFLSACYKLLRGGFQWLRS